MMPWKRRRLVLWAGLLILGGAVWLGFYVWDQGFTRKWRGLIARELAKHGLRAEIGRLTLDPVEGLTARDVRLFDVAHRDQRLAEIDRISLDIDVARLVNQEDFLRTLHLQKADVSLPVDPGDPRSEWLVVRDLNARLIFQPGRIEIARAEGQVSGILVKASGSVRKPAPRATTREERERQKEERSRQLQEMRDRRGALRTVLRAMDRFTVPGGPEAPRRPHKAELTLEVQGDLSDMAKMEIRADLTGGELEHKGGMIEGFEGMARLSEGVLTVQQLTVRDRFGALRASASWQVRGGKAVDLAVDCGMDLQALLRTVLDEAPWLDGAVFDTPPVWGWDGRWLLSPPPDGWPLEGLGHFRARRFMTRGVVFEGLQARAALQPEGKVYLRDVVLAHQTGELRGQVLMGPGLGRYGADCQMAPEPLLAFLPEIPVKQVLRRFRAGASARVAVRLEGGLAGGSGNWRHAGKVQLRDFTWDGRPVKEVAAEMEWNPEAEMPVIFRQALLEIPEGTARAREVGLDTEHWLLHLAGAEGAVQPPALLRLFNLPLARELEKYRFDQPPDSRCEGVIDLKGLERSDYRITLRTRGACGLDVAGRPMRFEQASGTLRIAGPELRLALTGATAPGTEVFGTLRLEEAAPATFAGVFPLSMGRPRPAVAGAGADGRAPQESWQTEVRAPGRVSLRTLGRVWPLEQFAGRMEAKGDRLSGTAGAQLLDGKFGASLQLPDAARRPARQEGSVVLENVSFSRLTAILDPARRSEEGKLSGNFTWQAPADPDAALTGRGKARLEEADIFALPLLGPLSSLVDALVPGEKIGYSVARSATASFTVAAGKVQVPDFTAATGTFRLTAEGTVDYVQDRVNLLTRVNLRGPPGMILYPVSKLFEYAADGTMSDPAWHPRIFGGPFRPKAAKEKEKETEEHADRSPEAGPSAAGSPLPVEKKEPEERSRPESASGSGKPSSSGGRNTQESRPSRSPLPAGSGRLR